MNATHSKPTQAAKILSHLKAHGSITPRESLDLYGCFRLAARIKELREAGHAIKTDNSAGFATYTLLQPVQAELSLT